MSFPGRLGKKGSSLPCEIVPTPRPHPSFTPRSSQTRSWPPQRQQALSLATAIRRLDRTILSIATISLFAADILGKTMWHNGRPWMRPSSGYAADPEISGGNRRFKGTRCRASFCRSSSTLVGGSIVSRSGRGTARTRHSWRRPVVFRHRPYAPARETRRLISLSGELLVSVLWPSRGL